MSAMKIFNWRPSGDDSLSSEYVDEPRSFRVKYVAYLLIFWLLMAGAAGWWWSSEPQPFDVSAQAAQRAGAGVVTGVTTVATVEYIVDVVLNKPGGYLSNDIMPPGLWLDNIPSWEFGVLVQVRDISKALRESFSRSQSQSTEDPDLAVAEPRFHVDHVSWAVPWPESEYAEGADYLHAYLVRLSDKDDFNGQFFSRADNLRYWLSTVETRLGSLSQRLSASVGQRRINTDLAGDDASVRSTPAPREVEVKTGWLQIDNVFYEARGTSWALLHLLQAVKVDFADVLEKKNARASLEQIIRELEGAQQPLYSPIILNGGGFGLFANHSLVMASYISRANAAIIDLRELLSRG